MILLAVDAIVLAGIIVPQRTNINEAQDLLEQTQNQLNAVKIEYERQQENLDYMKTTDYKLQQGAAKYGWHYEDDEIIYDGDNTSLTGNQSLTGGTASPSPSPSVSPSAWPSASPSVTPGGTAPAASSIAISTPAPSAPAAP